MYKFGNASKEKLSSINYDLQRLLCAAIKVVDFSILEGHRGQKKQDEYFAAGVSKVKFPNGKHNAYPSDAVDIAPYPYPKGDTGIRQAYYLAGVITGLAIGMDIKIRIGCDWNQDGDIRNDKFQDVWHIEIVE